MNKILFFCFLLPLTSIQAKPLAKFIIATPHLEAPVEVSFQNASENAETYHWSFGDGNESTDVNARHRYSIPGKYKVTLTARKGKHEHTMTQHIHIDPPAKCIIEITTELGVIVAELYDATPQHRDNFMKLAEEGFYNGTMFHRVIEGFMIQGGDPNSKNAEPGVPLGMGGPGYMVPGEFVDTLVHIRGAIAAARTGDAVNPERKSSGSQFYIVQGSPVDNTTLDGIERRKGVKYTEAARKAYLEHGGTPFLDHDYSVFGHVISGMEVVDAIARSEKDARDRPKKDVVMNVRVIK